MDKYKFETHPIANSGSIVQGPKYRFTLLNERLIRFEWAEDNDFEDRASTFAINREFPVPKFRVVDDDSWSADPVWSNGSLGDVKVVIPEQE